MYDSSSLLCTQTLTSPSVMCYCGSFQIDAMPLLTQRNTAVLMLHVGVFLPLFLVSFVEKHMLLHRCANMFTYLSHFYDSAYQENVNINITMLLIPVSIRQLYTVWSGLHLCSPATNKPELYCTK